MQLNICLLRSAIAETFATVSESGRLTLADRYGLMAALLDDSLSDEDKMHIDRLLYGARRGWLKIANEISTVMS